MGLRHLERDPARGLSIMVRGRDHPTAERRTFAWGALDYITSR
jgi:hypothetical protein